MVTTNILGGRLVYDASKAKALLLLSPTTGVTFATFNCGTETLTVRGKVLGVIGTINKAVTANTVTFKLLANSAQEFESGIDEGINLSNIFLETEDKGILPFVFEMSAIEGSDSTSTASAIEVKA